MPWPDKRNWATISHSNHDSTERIPSNVADCHMHDGKHEIAENCKDRIEIDFLVQW